MSLKSAVQQASRQVFRVAESVLTEVNYIAFKEAIYDPATGTVNPSTTDYLVKVAFASFKDSELLVGVMSGSGQFPQLLQPTDRKAVMLATDFPEGFIPTTLDKLEETISSKVWGVVAVKREPTESLILLQVREI